MRTVRHNTYYKRVILSMGGSEKEVDNYTPEFTRMAALFILGRGDFDFNLQKYRRSSKQFGINQRAIPFQWVNPRNVVDTTLTLNDIKYLIADAFGDNYQL